jgi:tRNA uridine 5-carboxymethylaminomethyl modification enzyme
VLIDDLIQLGTNEPYRMFTSRAEYRLRLRQDNADQRLTPLGHEMGLVSNERFGAFEQRRQSLLALKDTLAGRRLAPTDPLVAILGIELKKEATLLDLLKRPETIANVFAEALAGQVDEDNLALLPQLAIETKYEGYIKRQDKEIERIRRHEQLRLPLDLRYDEIEGLSSELKQKLKGNQPESLARAARIPGMTPAALSILLVHAKRKGRAMNQHERPG